jgi:hypothetical protein
MDILRAIRTNLLFSWMNPVWSMEREAYLDIKKEVKKKSREEIERRMESLYNGEVQGKIVPPESVRPSLADEIKIINQFKSNLELFESMEKGYDLGGHVINPNMYYTTYGSYFKFSIFNTLRVRMSDKYIYVYLLLDDMGDRRMVRDMNTWKKSATDDVKDLYYEALDMIDKFNKENNQEVLTRDIIEIMKNKYYASKFDEEFNEELKRNVKEGELVQ